MQIVGANTRSMRESKLFYVEIVVQKKAFSKILYTIFLFVSLLPAFAMQTCISVSCIQSSKFMSKELSNYKFVTLLRNPSDTFRSR